MFESKQQYDSLDKKEIFNEQSRLINKINKSLSSSVYDNYVPQYKSLASIYQLFNKNMSPKKKVLLEEKILSEMVSETIYEEIQTKPHDKLVMKTFIKNFNSEYQENLLKEQKNLLSKYIMSFENNGLELKIFLNEEVSRIKNTIKNYINENSESSNVKQKTDKLLLTIEGFKNKDIDNSMITKILKLQNLIKEITN